MPAWLYGHGGFLERSVCETFIAVCVSISAWCAVNLRERPSSAFAVGLGLFAGAAVVLKPNAGLYFPALLLWLVLYAPEWARRDRAALVHRLVIAVAAAAALPAIGVLWLWRLSILREAAVAIVDFNRFYVGQGFTPDAYAVDFSKAVWLRVKTDPLWLAGGVGSVAAVWEIVRSRKLAPLAGLAVLWGGAAAAVIVVNGARLFNSYFINAFAPLAVLGAWLLAGVGESRVRRAVSFATAALMAVQLVSRHYPTRVLEWARADFDLLRGRSQRTAYLERFGGYANARGYSARANAELADYVRGHTQPDDRIFLFGINGAGVYFASDRLTAHRFLRVNFFVETDFPDPRFRLRAVTEELAVSRPRYLIFERLNSKSEMGKAVDRLPEDPDIIRLLNRYQQETRIEDFTLYRRLD